MTLEGQKILVVGGSSGIGLATAQAAAAAGALVTIAGRSQARLDEAKARIEGDAATAVMDAAEDASVEALFKDAAPFDHIVASAGAGGRGRIDAQTMAAAHASMNGKFWASYRIARAARLPGHGSLTFVGGMFAHKPAPETALIAAVNAALEGLTRGLAVDLAPVRVNLVAPGLIDTPLWDRMPKEQRQAMYDHTAKTLPVRRMGAAEDVAQAILFLVTNRFATGEVLMLEGGARLT